MIPPEKPKTAGEAIQQTLLTLRQIAGPRGLGIIPDTGPKGVLSIPNADGASPRDKDIHKLSAVCLSQMRCQLSASLEVLKHSVQAFETWPQSDTDAIQRAQRVKADAANRLRAISGSKQALSTCRRLAVTADPFATRSARAVHRLCILAEDAGATTFRDDSESSGKHSCEINVSGARFIIDFSFPDLSANDIDVSVKFRFLVDATTERPDVDVSSNFASLLRREKFVLIRRAFESLVLLERLSAKTAGVALTDTLRAFEDDLLGAQEVERKANVSDTDRIPYGHGLIVRTAVGLRITYMDSHYAVLGVEASAAPRQLSTSRAPLINRAGARPQTASPLPLFDFGECKMATVYAQYLLTLHPPVVVSINIAQKLERVTGIDDSLKSAIRAGSMRGTPVREIISGRDGRIDHGDGRGYWPSLQALLVPTVFGRFDNEDDDVPSKENGNENNRTHNPKRLVNEKVHWSQSAAEFIVTSELPNNQCVQFSHSGGDVIGAVMIRRVGLCHPREVQAVLAVLRQQIVFNEMFKGCFDKLIPSTNDLQPLTRQPIEVVASDAPSLLRLNFFDPVFNDIVSMVVRIELGGDIRVSLKSASGRQHVCSDRKATLILRLSRSVPLTIRAILQMGSMGSNVGGDGNAGRR